MNESLFKHKPFLSCALLLQEHYSHSRFVRAANTLFIPIYRALLLPTGMTGLEYELESIHLAG